MKLEKLNFNDFKKNSLSFSSLKSITGGAETTQVGANSGDPEDFIDDNGNTSYDCDKRVYNDNCE